MAVVNQKEYLKKYLSTNKKDEKKKKRKKNISDRVKIIDDDIDLSTVKSFGEAVNLLNTNEDAPQVVGVIDERPMHLRIDDYRKSDLWKPLGAQEDDYNAQLINLESRSSTSSRNKIVGGDDSSPVRKTVVDSSPPRRKRRNSDNSPPRRNYKENSPLEGNDGDRSPPRRKRRASNDSSPPRLGKIHPKSSTAESRSPPRRSRTLNNSPPRRSNTATSSITSSSAEPKRKLLPGNKKGKYLIPAKRTEKMTKTLDGKSAGLQSAQELVKENEAFREREDALFKSMTTDVSGANAAPIMRNRKTGKIRDLEKEAEDRREKEKLAEVNKAKYSRWGKGLKQVEDYEDRLAQDLHEMNKPLARYADDEDLERLLKERDREGDPMLNYIKKKRKKEVIESGKPLKPQYEGEFMPNRFGIVPGYRWDGVDRSNGYEKKWFDVQNSKRAEQEEIYKWSTEDM